MTKKQAVEFLEGLGLSLSEAINMFLKQVILHDGIPFEVKYPKFKPEVIDDPNTKKYGSFSEALEDLDI